MVDTVDNGVGGTVGISDAVAEGGEVGVGDSSVDGAVGVDDGIGGGAVEGGICNDTAVGVAVGVSDVVGITLGVGEMVCSPELAWGCIVKPVTTPTATAVSFIPTMRWNDGSKRTASAGSIWYTTT